MKEKICIIISTPFQLISAFSIVEQNAEFESDLYIIGNFKNYQNVADKVRKTGIFANVVTYSLNDIRIGQQSKNAVFRAAMRQISYMSYERSGRKIALYDRKYSRVYFAAAVSAAELIMYFQKHYKPEFYLFDDGVMTYRDIKWVNGEGEKFKTIKKLIYRCIGMPKPHIVVYSPVLFNSMYPKGEKVNELQVISERAKEFLCDIFDVSSEDIFDQPVTVIECKVSDYLTDESSEILENIYEQIIEKTGIQNIVFKRHPRDSRTPIAGREYLEGTVPFELFSCIDDLTNKVLVAWDSTAVLTPKLFYNQEPTIVLLYKLVEGKINNFEQTDRLYREFKEIYTDKTKFIIPETEQELKAAITIIMEKCNAKG